MLKEAKARIKINKLLEQAGWRFLDNAEGSANVQLETNVKITESKLNELGENFEQTTNGFVDFLLLNEKGFPLVVLEAKSEKHNPLDGKEQARRYAKSLSARFVILSNGNIHYFWDLEKGNPTIITKFPTQASLKHKEQWTPNPDNLISEVIESDYIALTQLPDYKLKPEWNNDIQRSDFIQKNNLKFLRDYQINAVRSIQNEVEEGKDRFLFEMATGTGKTLAAAAVIKLFLKTANVSRVLFLVDRLELEDQACRSFVQYLKNDFQTVIYKENRDDWNKAEIVVSTVQSFLFDNKYQRIFSPTDFDLIISDEAHRSINGNSRAVFEYFIGYKLGLTATPKDYLKNVDLGELAFNDHRAFEKRQLLDTYKTFGCETGDPTFRYSLIDGVKGNYLVNPIVADARTEITTQLLSDEGYAVMMENNEGKEEEKFFFQRDFERKFFSDYTNEILCKTFLDNALLDPITGEIGKSILFCVSQKHASKITQILNKLADKAFPGKYKSDFAIQVTSFISRAKQFSINFANNNLNGKTRFLEGYDSSRTRICVAVGMMTTGYDCRDILNIGLMRPIFSPTDFIQIKGRGTRKYTFKYSVKDGAEVKERSIEKENYKLFDFFANCEYFEEKYNYDEILKIPQKNLQKPSTGESVAIDQFRNTKFDPLEFFKETEVDENGMRIDREYFQAFAETLKEDSYLSENIEKVDMEELIEYVMENLMNKPEYYFTLERLRKAVNLDRRLTMREAIDRAFGKIDEFKTKMEIVNEEFNKFMVINKPENIDIPLLKLFMETYITDPEFRKIIDEKDYSSLATSPVINTGLLKHLKGWIHIVPEYVKDYISLNRFL